MTIWRSATYRDGAGRESRVSWDSERQTLVTHGRSFEGWVQRGYMTLIRRPHDARQTMRRMGLPAEIVDSLSPTADTEI